MGRMLDRAAAAIRANDLSDACTGPSSAATTCNRLFLRLLNEVIDRCGEKRGALATDAGYSEFQFSRKSTSLDFIDRLPAEIQRVLARRWAESLGFLVHEPVTDQVIAAIVEELRESTERVKLLTAAHLVSKERRR